MPFRLAAAIVPLMCTKFAIAQFAPGQIVDALRKPENSSGSIADAVEAMAGERSWINPDRKPLYDTKIVSRAATRVDAPGLMVIASRR